MRGPAYQQLAAKTGMIVDPIGPEECTKHIKNMWQLYTKVIKDFNLEVKK